MAVTRARSASQPGAGADSSTPNPGKPFGTRSPLYRCWPHRLSTSRGNDAGVLRKLGPQKPKAPPVATLFLRWSSAAPAVSHSRRSREDFTNAPPHSTTTRGLRQPNAFSGPRCRTAAGGSTGHARIAVGDASFRSLRARNDNGQKLGQQGAISRRPPAAW
jgi:hypothetical protein